MIRLEITIIAIIPKEPSNINVILCQIIITVAISIEIIITVVIPMEITIIAVISSEIIIILETPPESTIMFVLPLTFATIIAIQWRSP